MAIVLTVLLSFYDIAVYAALNRPPVISGNPATSVNAGSVYSFTPVASDPDNDILTFSITKKPAWISFDTKTGAMSGAPAKANIGITKGIIIAVKDSKGSTVRLPAFNLEVLRVNHAPTISGTPQISVKAGIVYNFTPTASDPDNDTLKFSIVNKPAWASFNIRTGVLSGTPKAANAGTTRGVIITVDDGYGGNASLPAFDLTVVPNQPPTISGTPATSASIGTAYSFIPAASDPDNDTLTFSIANKPAWASSTLLNPSIA